MKFLFLSCLLFLLVQSAKTQDFLSGGKVTGNAQIDAQIYSEDEKLGITDSTMNFREFGLNAFANVMYSNGNFNAGLRFESYLNPMLGFDDRYEGVGIPYWFAKYKVSSLELTAGHFYDQFGSGMILRSWEEWTLGYDNNLYGFNAKFTPARGITLKGLIGVHRYFWEPYTPDSRGIVRGVDGEFYLNDFIGSMADTKTRITLGGSFVSRYQKASSMGFTRDALLTDVDEFGDTTEILQRTTYAYNLPVNVGSYAVRLNLARGGFNFFAEYVEKENDPNATNNYIYKHGSGVYSTISYSVKGFGLYFATKWIDNMNYKSSRTESGQPPMLDINYLPVITNLHQYSLAVLYPYATQLNGEAGFQGQLLYTIPKKTKLGGKYGTNITVSYSYANSIERKPISENIPIDSTGTEGYTTQFLSIGDIPYYRDFNVLVKRKINSKINLIAAYYHQLYNLHVIEDEIYDDDELVNIDIAVLDFTYKFNRRHSLRTEFQGLWTKEDDGNWAALTLEYQISPTWFFSVMDEYNYGNPVKEDQIHYYNVAFGYTDKTNRISLRYGRQREGLLCVGGVCRFVPASSGLTLTITTSF